jgi:hypothetical protein
MHQASRTLTQSEIQFAKIVEQSGCAKFEGLLRDDSIALQLILFTSKKTGSTYGMHPAQCTVEGVRKHCASLDASCRVHGGPTIRAHRPRTRNGGVGPALLAGLSLPGAVVAPEN